MMRNSFGGSQTGSNVASSAGYHPSSVPHAASSNNHTLVYPNGSTSGPGKPALEFEEFQEIKAITLEWKLSNLQSIFESSRGEAKSRCIKSSVFGDGKWEIYFYANSVCATTCTTSMAGLSVTLGSDTLQFHRIGLRLCLAVFICRAYARRA